MATTTQPKTSSMINGASPTIFVADMDRAARFYTEVLGLSIQFRAGNEFCMIDAGAGSTIGLHPPGQHSPRPGTSGSIQVGLNVTESIEQVVSTLRSRGVNFHGPVINDTAVKLAFFNDPDGNDLYLCQVMH